MKVFTIGFTRKSADRFFGLLRDSGAKRVVDVRLNNAGKRRLRNPPVVLIGCLFI